MPKTGLECSVISSNLEHIQMDYRYGLEIGLDALPHLRALVDKGFHYKHR